MTNKKISEEIFEEYDKVVPLIAEVDYQKTTKREIFENTALFLASMNSLKRKYGVKVE
jgi:hypothetical protein